MVRVTLLSTITLCVSFHHHMWNQIGVIVRERQIRVKIDIFVTRDLELWQMTLKNSRAPLLCYFKLCASFQSYWWIQTGVTVRKRQIWVKINDLFSRVTFKFDGWPWKSIGHLSLATSSFVYHFIIICGFKMVMSYGPEMAKLGFDLCDLDLWPLTLTFCMDITPVIGNNPWKIYDDMMVIT